MEGAIDAEPVAMLLNIDIIIMVVPMSGCWPLFSTNDKLGSRSGGFSGTTIACICPAGGPGAAGVFLDVISACPQQGLDSALYSLSTYSEHAPEA